jgi:RNA polymerase sigma-70 factor, ECF subfamily
LDRPSGDDVEFRQLCRSLDSSQTQATARPFVEALAILAATYEPARQRLLTELVERDLAMIPIRALFFEQALIDDALQETLIAVFSGISTFRGESSFRTWLDRVARNSALKVRRRHLRSNSGPDQQIDAAVWTRRISSMVADEQIVNSALDQLRPEHREVLVLREIDGFSYEAISLRLGVPVGTVRSRLSRARQDLLTHLLRSGAEV